MQLAERTERALAPICLDHLPPSGQQVTAFLGAIDTLRQLLEDSGETTVDTAPTLATLAELGHGLPV